VTPIIYKTPHRFQVVNLSNEKIYIFTVENLKNIEPGEHEKRLKIESGKNPTNIKNCRIQKRVKILVYTVVKNQNFRLFIV
jgi:hypothetical protein